MREIDHWSRPNPSASPKLFVEEFAAAFDECRRLRPLCDPHTHVDVVDICLDLCARVAPARRLRRGR